MLPDSTMSNIQHHFWRFITGDTPTAEFEQWVYNTTELKELPNDIYFNLISADYKNIHSVAELRNGLEEWLRKIPGKCDCITWANKQIIPMGSKNSFIGCKAIKERAVLHELVKCPHCGTYWYSACDEHKNDDYYIIRLQEKEVKNIIDNNKWPYDFENFKDVWPDKVVKLEDFKVACRRIQKEFRGYTGE